MIVDKLVNEYFEELNQSDLYIWEYISTHKEKCQNLTIDELAKECNISKTSIIRFAKKISLTGYSELKTYLKMENKKSEGNKENILDMFVDSYVNSIQDLKNKNLDSILQMIYGAKRVFLYGTGALQTNAAEELCRMFFCGGDYFYCLNNKVSNEDMMLNINQEDMVIIISLSGNGDAVVELAKKLKLKGIKILSITKSKYNKLASLSDENLYFSNISMKLLGDNDEEFESTASIFMICEILYIRCQQYKAKLRGE